MHNRAITHAIEVVQAVQQNAKFLIVYEDRGETKYMQVKQNQTVEDVMERHQLHGIGNGRIIIQILPIVIEGIYVSPPQYKRPHYAEERAFALDSRKGKAYMLKSAMKIKGALSESSIGKTLKLEIENHDYNP